MKWFFFFLLLFTTTRLASALEVTGIAQSLLPDSIMELKDDELNMYKERAAHGNASAADALSAFYLKKGEDFYSAGVSWAIKSAKDGSPQGMINAGVCYYDGLGVDKNHQVAAQFFLQALESGHNRVLNALAYMYATGDGIPRDEAKALACAEKAVAAGLPHALPTLAYMHAKGIGTPVDTAKAKKLLREELSRNPAHGNTYNTLAVIISQESDDHWQESAPLFQKAADLGCTSAYLPLAHAYWKGKGVEMNLERAAAYMQKAVEAEDGNAYAYMAEMYLNGEGVPQNPEMAEKLYRDAIAHNAEDSYSYYSLAELLSEKPTSTSHAAEIEELMEQSAKLGNLAAMEYLVHEYAQSNGLLPQNLALYARWCCAAADKGATWALLPAVALYEHDCAPDQDGSKAIKFCKLAVERNVYGATGCLAAIYAEGKLTPQDLEKAEELYRQSIRLFPSLTPVYAQLAQCMLHRSSDRATLKEAFELLKTGAEQGDTTAYLLLSKAYEDGWAFEGDSQLPPDKEKARIYAEQAEKASASAPVE